MENRLLDEQLLLTSKEFLESKKYWVQYLKQALTQHDYVSWSVEGKEVVPITTGHYVLDIELSDRIRSFCKNNDLSIYIFMLTACCVVIRKLKNTPAFKIVTPLFDRYFNESSLQYNSGLPLVCIIDDKDTFRQQLAKVKEIVVGAMRNQHYPLEKIYSEPGLHVFGDEPDVAFSYDVLQGKAIQDKIKAAFAIQLGTQHNDIYLDLSNRRELPVSAGSFFLHLCGVIATVLENLSIQVKQIALVKEERERDRLLKWSNADGYSGLNGFDLTERLWWQMMRQPPDGIAVRYRDKTLTYGRLLEVASGMAACLRNIWRLIPGDRVVVLIDRSEWTLVSLLALLKAGLIYVPVDTGTPPERVKLLLEDAMPSLVITEQRLLEQMDEYGFSLVSLAFLVSSAAAGDMEEMTEINLNNDNEAYIIYTSGSSGLPKGVVVNRGSLGHFFEAVYMHYTGGHPLNMPFLASPAFDISIFQLLAPVLSGGICQVIDKDQLQDLSLLVPLLLYGNTIDTVPALYHLIADYILSHGLSSDFDTVGKVFVGGDAISDDLLHKLSAAFRKAVIIVTYGPTEATIFCASKEYLPRSITETCRGSVIGHPMNRAEIYILGEDMQLLPAGVTGEIFIGGPGIANGYLGQPSLTQDKFVSHPYRSGALLYRTGDLGRWTADGMIEFRGRNDAQVKINGHRIEPGEIAARIKKHECVADAVVVPVSKGSRGVSLAAYYVEKRVVQVWPSISEYLGYNDIAYFAMNNDELRAGSYKKAIYQLVRDKVVVDVGTGPEAILARHCLDAGAKRVYAIEILEEVYLKAKNRIKLLGLQDKIILIQGDVMDVQLPELADYCVCALVGNMGSSDGCIPIMNSARRLIKDPASMIPYRSLTRISAISLPDPIVDFRLTKTGGYYMDNIFASAGHHFDLRVGLQNVTEDQLISTIGVFEDLDLTRHLTVDEEHDIELEITRNATMSGFLVWLQLYTAPGILNDIFQSQKSFLPIYFPVFDPGIIVRKGDVVRARIKRATPAGGIYPDYFISGDYINSDGWKKSFSHRSERFPGVFRGNGFYRKLFPDGEARVKPLFTAQSLRDYIQQYLPEYMVPAHLTELEALPLTSNGKIDRKALPEVGSRGLHSDEYAGPSTELQRVLSEVWRELLKVERVGIHDNFFVLGGDSIITIQVVSRMRRHGYELQPRDMFQYQDIATLSQAMMARQMGSGLAFGEQGYLGGVSGLTPVQQLYLGMDNPSVSHFNQSVLLGVDKGIGEELLSNTVERLVTHHDSLRFRYGHHEGIWEQSYGDYKGRLDKEDLRQASAEELPFLIEECADGYQRSLSIGRGELVRFVWMELPSRERYNRLLIVIHHLVVDGVSWRILLEDMEEMLGAGMRGVSYNFGVKGSSYRQWYEALFAYGKSRRLEEQKGYWQKIVDQCAAMPRDRDVQGVVRREDMSNHMVCLSKEQTAVLLQEIGWVYHTEVNDILLCALGLTLSEWSGREQVVIWLEGHGREDVGEGIDTSRTVGWFASLYPVLLEMGDGREVGDCLKGVKETLRGVPDKGVGYGVLRYINREHEMAGAEMGDIVFNYLGRIDNVVEENKWLTGVRGSMGKAIGDDNEVMHKLEVNSIVQRGELIVSWGYSRKHYEQGTIKQLAERYMSDLERLIRICQEQGNRGCVHTPSDYGLGKEVSYAELDEFMSELVEGQPRGSRIEGLYRLSGLQEGMLFHSLYNESGTAYLVQLTTEMQGLQLNLFRECWDHILQRHSILRSAFYHDVFRVPVQCVFREVTIPVEILDYRDMADGDREVAVTRFEEEDRLKGFDFKRAPLIRISLIRVSEGKWRMIWTSHHILTDGWSLPVLLQELRQEYEALAAGRQVVQAEEDKYEDYIRYIEQRDKYVEGAFWRKYLEGFDEPALLPFVRLGKERNKGLGEYKSVSIQLSVPVSEQLNAYAQEYRITVNTVMQGIWALLLHRYTGREDIVYGVTVSGRPEEMAGVERRVGMYINTLPLRSVMDEEQEVRVWLASIQQQQSESREYQYSSLSDIQKWTGLHGDLFDSLLVFENYPANKDGRGSKSTLSMGNTKMRDQVNYPLGITIATGREVLIRLDYNSSLIPADYVTNIAGHFEKAVCSIVAGPADTRLKDLSIMTGAEKEQLLTTFNSAVAGYEKGKTIVDMICEQAARTPEAVAVVFEGESISYQELEERSNQLGNYLRKKGIREEQVVGICLERSFEMIIGILGILKAGAAYMPIDPGYPSERIAYMLEDSGVPLLLSSGRVQARIPRREGVSIIALDERWFAISGESGKRPITGLHAQHLAYIIYTSGSTGRPKGVMMEHKGLLNRLQWGQDRYTLGAGDAVLQKTNFCFDISAWELLWPLITGGRLVFARPGGQGDAHYLQEIIKEQRITTLHFVPSMLASFLESSEPADCKSLRNVFCSGEALKPAEVNLFKTRWPEVGLHNLYGPTEAAIEVSFWDAPAAGVAWDRIPIGRPATNTRLYVLDGRKELCPIGSIGELCIAGVQLARGYVNLPEQTAEKFVPDPFAGESNERMYRTGDLARWLPDGNIEFLGRRDHQVKIRGHRIELGEVESWLLESGKVRQAIVTAREDKLGSLRLTGYIVPDGAFDQEGILSWMKRHVPAYMVPSMLMELGALPLTANGKVDRRALPEPGAGGLSTKEYLAPGSKTELSLAAMWQNLLDRPAIGIRDNFFEMGGHSLLTTRLASAIKKEFGLTMSMKMLFELTTIQDQAAYIDMELASYFRQQEDPAAFDVIQL